MKRRTTVNVRPLKVIQNTHVNKPDYIKVVDANTKELLHQGQVPYIKRVLVKKYNRQLTDLT